MFTYTNHIIQFSCIRSFITHGKSYTQTQRRYIVMSHFHLAREHPAMSNYIICTAIFAVLHLVLPYHIYLHNINVFNAPLLYIYQTHPPCHNIPTHVPHPYIIHTSRLVRHVYMGKIKVLRVYVRRILTIYLFEENQFSHMQKWMMHHTSQRISSLKVFYVFTLTQSSFFRHMPIIVIYTCTTYMPAPTHSNHPSLHSNIMAIEQTHTDSANIV